MKLPNAANAVIKHDKLVLYLLDLDHRRGGSKAKLLHTLGYNAENWQQLAADLRQDHVSADVAGERDTTWGKRYDIVAPLTGPSGNMVLFHSVLQIDIGTDCPRLITIYPE